MRKNIFVKSMAALMAATLAFAPISANAAPTLRTVDYNPAVTTAKGELKLGYYEVSESESDTWWKVESYYKDWEKVTKDKYDAVTDDDLKMVDRSGRTDWYQVDEATYSAVYSKDRSRARKNGTTDWYETDKAGYMAAEAINSNAVFGKWTPTDKATYDAETDGTLKKTYKSEWKPFADTTNWLARYDEWAKYPQDMRRANGTNDFKEVSQDVYLEFAQKFPNMDNILYKYEDVSFGNKLFTNWVFFDEQIIANKFIAANAHDPYKILVGEFDAQDSYQGCPNVTYFNDQNGVSAQNVAKYTMELLNNNNIPYVTINSGSDIPALGANKKNEHANDGIHNAGTDGGNGFIDIVDEDFQIYYYAGSGEIEVQELYGILIAPNATVKVGGKWIGTVLADVVTYASNWGESTAWCYPIHKGEAERKYFVCDPSLEVKDDVYEVRTVKYYVRDNIYEVCDVIEEFFIRGFEEQKFYCKAVPYVPKTGDTGSLVVLYGLLGILAIGVTFVCVSSKKRKNNEVR